MVCLHCGQNNNPTAVNCSACGKWLPLPPRSDEGQSAIPMNAPRSERVDASPSVPSQPASAPGASTPGWQAPPVVLGPEMPYAAPSASLSPLPAHGSLSAAPAYPGQMLFCKVCGTGLFPGQAACLRCKTPPGFIVNPNDPTATTFLPFGTPVHLVPVLRTTPAASSRDQTERLGGWNWGAALLPTVWSARHRVTWLTGVSGLITFLMFSLILFAASLHRTPDVKGTLTGFLVSFALIFWLPRSLFVGLWGNTLAWRSGLYADKEILRKAQRSWTLWAIIGFAGVTVTLAAAIAVLLAT